MWPEARPAPGDNAPFLAPPLSSEPRPHLHCSQSIWQPSFGTSSFPVTTCSASPPVSRPHLRTLLCCPHSCPPALAGPTAVACPFPSAPGPGLLPPHPLLQ